jgi:hypothetical protein
VCFATAGNLQAQSNAFLVSPASVNFSYQSGAANQPQFQDITVLTTQTNVSFTAVLTTNGGGNWLNGGATVPTTPGSVRLFVVTTGLAPAVYTGQVAISAPGLATVNVPVTFKVTNTSEISGNPAKQVADGFQFGFAARLFRGCEHNKRRHLAFGFAEQRNHGKPEYRHAGGYCNYSRLICRELRRNHHTEFRGCE